MNRPVARSRDLARPRENEDGHRHVEAVVDVRGITKSYGGRFAVHELSFDVRRGEIFGLVGPNGAGKTTTIECIVGLRRPDEGAVSVLGRDPTADRIELFQRVGVQLQESNLYPRIKAREALELFASFHRDPRNPGELLAELGLESAANQAYADLSTGQRRRLMVAAALVGRPELVILDEPTTGLDPQARHNLWAHLERGRRDGLTVLCTTHYLEEAEHHCGRVAIIDDGDVIALGPPAALLRQHGLQTRVVVQDPEGQVRRRLDGASGVTAIQEAGGQLLVFGAGDALQEAVHAALTGAGRPPLVDLRPATLEDLFLHVTGTEYREG